MKLKEEVSKRYGNGFKRCSIWIIIACILWGGIASLAGFFIIRGIMMP